ncbi:hypothetical protein BS50DRAFT_533154 [Corynespora cassiicola Philippines]|uniref:Nudix hydrolase domain-containing protein n=1 Tax=Corynespora cassiicola Philippines TaxID=1448308 RepID=A0A2T2N9U4_CORCC|nr:hypothetical protein BS50DRAFT_533154 [Corynespora cassiicola Philippines]
MTVKGGFSNLELVARVDKWPYFQKDPVAYKKHMEDYYYFLIEGYEKPFGYVHSSTVPKVNWGQHWTIDENRRFIKFNGGNTFDGRYRRMEEILRCNLKQDETSAFGRWRNELFPIYDAKGKHVLSLDGAGIETFGILSYGCHLIAFVMTSDGLKYWVPRRAKTKLSYPGMLDNIVGGILRANKQPIDCIVRECAEEASLPEEYTKSNIVACGSLSYQMTQTDYGKPGCRIQVQYLYEMELSKHVVPEPFDGEVQEFNLMSLEEVISALRKGEFKLNCAMTWMAYLIRHRHVNAENEPNLVEISSRLHRKHDLFVV